MKPEECVVEYVADRLREGREIEQKYYDYLEQIGRLQEAIKKGANDVPT